MIELEQLDDMRRAAWSQFLSDGTDESYRLYVKAYRRWANENESQSVGE